LSSVNYVNHKNRKITITINKYQKCKLSRIKRQFILNVFSDFLRFGSKDFSWKCRAIPWVNRRGGGNLRARPNPHSLNEDTNSFYDAWQICMILIQLCYTASGNLTPPLSNWRTDFQLNFCKGNTGCVLTATAQARRINKDFAQTEKYCVQQGVQKFTDRVLFKNYIFY
jgi:hypothetical protein